MPAAGHQALLLLLTARLASPGLLAARDDGSQHRPARGWRLESLSRFSRRAAHGAADELRAGRWNLVRWNVGQARCGLAAAADLRADPSAPARGAHRAEPSQGAAARRGCADVRAGPPGR